MNTVLKSLLTPLLCLCLVGGLLSGCTSSNSSQEMCIRDRYFRPEIVGLVGGALIMALIGKEFSPKGGSAPVTRFFLGAFVMIGALVFLGCPLRMVLRLSLIHILDVYKRQVLLYLRAQRQR